MNSHALEKAKGRLRSAQRSKAAMLEHAKATNFEDYWLDFLTAWKACYQKVEQAAKDTPQELQWFGAVKAERRGDPLLRYLFEARNDEQHGVIASLTHVPAQAVFRAVKDFAVEALRLVMYNGLVADVVNPQGERIAECIGNVQADSTLQPVKDRGGHIVPAPTSHQGNVIEPNPHVAADLGLQWLEALMVTAEAMSKP